MGLTKVLPLLLICILFSSFVFSDSLTYYDETASLSRIVGDSPKEIIKQLIDDDDINLKHASYLSGEADIPFIDDPSGVIKKLIKLAFDDDVRVQTSTDHTYLKSSSTRWKNNELLIIEDVYNLLKPRNSESFIDVFKRNNPLLFLQRDYGGLYLPKSFDNSESFVGGLGQDSTIIAPNYKHDTEFSKAFACALMNQNTKSVGDALRRARNRFFHDNLQDYSYHTVEWNLLQVVDGEKIIIDQLDSEFKIWKESLTDDNKPDTLGMISYQLYGMDKIYNIPSQVYGGDIGNSCAPYFYDGEFCLPYPYLCVWRETK